MLAWIPACTGKDDAATESASEATAQVGTDGETNVTETAGATAVVTGGEESVGDESVGDESVGAETVGAETGETETAGVETVGEETVGEDTGFVPPVECDSPDPTVKASFELALTGWPIDPEDFDVAAPCKVDLVTTAAGMVNTALTCEFEGESRVAALAIAAPGEGEVVWTAGDDVTLAANLSVDPLEGAQIRNVGLRGSDGGVLVVGTDSMMDELFETRFEPLAVALVRICGEGREIVYEPARVDFTPPGGEVVGIVSGQRGTVLLADQERLAIEVEQATISDLHGTEDTKVLLRRVKVGG